MAQAGDEQTDGTERDLALDEVREKYRKGDLVLFVGAGVSAAAKLPSWGELVGQLTIRAKARGARPEALSEIEDLISRRQYIDAITAVRDLVGEPELIAVVERMLDDRQLVPDIPEIGKAIAALAPHLRAVLTTNLDHLLERALGWPVLHRATGNVAQKDQIILKLHGTLLDAGTWVLTREQYERAMYNDAALADAVSSTFRARTLLFVGYGLADDDFDQVLARVSALSGANRPRHFALVHEAEAKPYWRKRREGAGVRVITYKSHADVPGILRWIAADDAKPAPAQLAAKPVDLSGYVRREAEEEAALALLDTPGKPVVLWGPHRFGKTMMLRYLLGRVRAAGGQERSRIVEVDLSMLLPEPVALDGLLANLAAYLVDRLCDDEAPLAEVESKKRLTWPLKLERLLGDHLLPAAPERLVLAIDAADAVWGQPFQAAFYRMLRMFCERTQDPWPRLRLVLLLASTPSLVFHDSPLTNLAASIELGDFGPEQVVEMARQHRLDWARDAVERHVRPLFGGHPYLLHLLMDHARRSGASIEQLTADRDALLDLFAEPLAELGRLIDQDARLRDGVLRLLADDRSRLDEDLLLRLRRAGLVERTPEGGYRIRYGLYDAYLRRRWQAKPEA
ncbi:MAG: AAA-like domain-containing protein [Minicystis sp.]